MASYNSALDLLDDVVADDPTGFTTLATIDLTRHGIRQLSATSQTDKRTLERHSNVDAKIDRAFSEGIGRFQFGMTFPEVNRLLSQPFGETNVTRLPRATEYETGDVRYVWKWLRDEPDLVPFKVSECLFKDGYVVLMFHDGVLFRVVFRFMHDDNCPEQTTIVDAVAREYEIPSTGSPVEREIPARDTTHSNNGCLKLLCSFIRFYREVKLNELQFVSTCQ